MSYCVRSLRFLRVARARRVRGACAALGMKTKLLVWFQQHFVVDAKSPSPNLPITRRVVTSLQYEYQRCYQC